MDLNKMGREVSYLHKHMTVAEAMTIIGRVLGVEPRETFSPGAPQLELNVEPGWALGCSLSVIPHIVPDAKGQGVHGWAIRATVNGSSSFRTPSQARAFARMYGELADLACLVEAMAGDLVFLTQEQGVERDKAQADKPAGKRRK